MSTARRRKNNNDTIRTRLLWTCPKCGVKLLTRNLSHSCGRATLDDWKGRMGPQARALYDRFEQLIASCGEYHIGPAKTRISFLGRVRFANITAIREDRLAFNFALPKAVRSTRILKTQEIIPGWTVHYLQVSKPSELDAQIQGWLRRSYRLMGMQQRLDRG